MKTFKLILKGILLYTTIIVCTLSLALIDGIYDTSLIFVDILVCAVLVFSCIKFITEEELYKLTLCKHIEDKLNN